MKALITGANKGIGYEIARHLGQKGYTVFIGARSEARGQEAVEKLTAEGLKAEFIAIDLNKPETFKAAADSGKLDGLDILVNNAGIPDAHKEGHPDLDPSKTALDYTTDDLRATMEVNFFGTHTLIKTLLPKLAEHAKIVNITIPIMPRPFFSPLAYQTSKAALNILTVSLAAEFAKTGSKKQIFGIMPGAVGTDLNGHKEGELGGVVRSAQAAGSQIADIISTDKNQNGQMIQYDGKIVTDYELQLSQN